MSQTHTTFSAFRAHLQSLADDPHAAARYASEYIASHTGNFPLLEGNTVHFVYRPPHGMLVGVSGEWNGFDPRKSLMEPIGGDFVHYQHIFESDARIDYLIVEVAMEHTQEWFHNKYAEHIHTRTLCDPLNTCYGESGFGPRSELAMPKYRRPAVSEVQPACPRGELQQRVITSHILQCERIYTVYLPAGYQHAAGPYPSVYFHDGDDYLSMGKAPTILDNLIHAGRIPPVVAIFVAPINREHEYNCDDHFVRFFCDELVPEMEHLYHLSPEQSKRGVIGPSLGGLISLYMGCQRPDVFGLVGAQSTATHSTYGLDKFNASLAVAVEPRLPLRLHLAIGSYEECFSTDGRGRCHDLLNPVRNLRTVLERYEYPLRYVEQHQGHSWSFWRDSLADVFTYFFSGDRA